MADYVVDTSIIIQRVIRDTYTEETRRLFKRLALLDQFWIPEICLVECVNVLWKQVRFHSLPQHEAEFLAQELIAYPFTVEPAEFLLLRALQISVEHKLAIYDSVYIALAEKYHLPLITADARQAAAAQQIGVTLKSITDF